MSISTKLLPVLALAVSIGQRAKPDDCKNVQKGLAVSKLLCPLML
jgi:hypothetical protein